jgi:hypothetical protein
MFSCVFGQQQKVQKKAVTRDVVKPSEVAGKGTIFFDLTSYNFKLINEELGKQHADFTFTNIGKGELRILSVETGCGCTSAEWDKSRVYKQGDKDRITIYFNPKNIDGKFSRTITVLTDGDPPIANLSVEGDVYGPTKQLSTDYPFVYGGLRLSANVFNFPHVLDDRHDSTMLKIYNASDKRIQILGFRGPEYIKGILFRPFVEPKEYTAIGVFIYPELAKMYGPLEDQFVVVTNETDMPVKNLLVKASIVENFANLTPDQQKHHPQIVFTEKEKDLGEVYYGEVVDYDFEVTNKGKSDLILRRAYGSCGCTVAKVSSEPIKKGKKGKVSVRFDAKNLMGIQTKSITVISNDPDNPVTTLTIRAKLVEPGIKK